MLHSRAARLLRRLLLPAAGLAALLWFLLRVIPKPSRASYPCQRAAFPIASGFVLWLAGTLALRHALRRSSALCAGLATLVALALWPLLSLAPFSAAAPANGRFDFSPMAPNAPVGVARGIFPGRVVWAHDPQAAKWPGHFRETANQWWLDENTDQTAVDSMLSATLTSLTGASTPALAWQSLFSFYNAHARALPARGYQPGEIVAIKINLNNATSSAKTDNFIDASPQMVLAMVRQLVNQAHVRPADILVYDARRFMMPYTLTKVWREFPDVRFLQQDKARDNQPRHPLYNDYSRLEAPIWVPGVEYSKNTYNDARLIPKQVLDATYLVNFALLKAHSYPYNEIDGGDSGQTALTLTGKNHFGSIKGTAELHAAINTEQEGRPNSYSPLVDLAASPNLGAKTILYLLDGLYAGRKWQSYPQHFPNFPFNNRAIPYENTDWPASLLASLDPVALDSVGLDLLLAQTRNNLDDQGRPRILIRENADGYLFEMANPLAPPSRTAYRQNGRPVSSLGVHEHWENDATMRYSRNIDPTRGQGIELVFLPLGASAGRPAERALAASLANPSTPRPAPPAALPSTALDRYDFFYAGEGKEENMYVLRQGRIAWHYRHPGRGEISDAVRLSDGSVLFAHQYGITLVSAEKKVLWHIDAPPGTEIHTAQPIGKDFIVYVRNGNPARLIVLNRTTGQVAREFDLPVANPKSVHGQFRHARLTRAGTILIAHMDSAKVAEYDATGRELWSLPFPGIWSASELDNGNILLAGRSTVREVSRAGATVWEWNASAAPEYRLSNFQLATRLPNGNTLVNSWFNQWDGNADPATAPIQAVELTPAKQIVWGLRSWTPPADLGPSTVIQILRPGDAPPENVHFGEFH